MQKETSQNIPEVLFHFAEALGVKIKDNTVSIPKAFGAGYCSAYKFGNHIRLLMMNYELNQGLVLKNTDGDIKSQMILFKLQHVFPDKAKLSYSLPSVLIATRKVEADIIMPVDTHTAAVIIEIDAAYLTSLLDTATPSTILSSLLQNKQPLLFEEAVYPSLLQIVSEILASPVKDPFRHFFIRIKAEELVCRLLMELEKREEKQLLPLNQADIQMLYKIKEKILTDLSTPPVLAELSVYSNMSVSKLKILFKQVFGKSIYSYYQQFRMKEAARLLSEEKLSVSQAGYHLGFSNLSHFSRVFEHHIGLKPKKYAMSQ